MLRRLPTRLTPPPTNSAFVIVASELTVYEPGWLTSPVRNTRTERSSPSEMLDCTPIISRAMRSDRFAFRSSKRWPAT